MKTPEDEAFDDLARKQGAWGGGFPAKRQMAMDKLHWSDCAVHNAPAYPAGPCDCGVAQEPEREALKLALEALEEAHYKIEHKQNAAKREQAITAIREALAQPAQEPYDQTALELCNVCGWKTLIPNDGCLNCERKEKPAQQEAIYGMNQDDWKDVVAAITKVRDGRGIYLGCRPVDVFKDWFLALGTAKVKEKNNG
jgi:hypothetical protein